MRSMRLAMLLALTPMAAWCVSGVQQTTVPARIEIVQNMDFSDLVLDDLGGSIALTERNQLVSYSGTIHAGMLSASREARIRLVGPPKAAFSVLVDPEQPILRNARGGAIRVVNIIHQAQAFNGNLDDQGVAEIHLGARLDIPAGTLPGLYVQPMVKIRYSLLTSTPQVVTESFSISCNLRPFMQLTNRTPLDFGKLIPGNTLSTYRVRSDGSAGPVSGNVRQFRGTPMPAEFFVTGTAGTDYCLQLPRSVFLHGPGGDIQIHSFEASVPLPGTMPKGGFPFKVGASITIPPTQRPGYYEGTFVVTINYP